MRAAVAAAANLTELIEAHKEDFVCCVCMENAIQVRFDPCKHSACCARCASRLGQYELSTRRCPLCRANIKHVVDLATAEKETYPEPRPLKRLRRVSPQWTCRDYVLDVLDFGGSVENCLAPRVYSS